MRQAVDMKQIDWVRKTENSSPLDMIRVSVPSSAGISEELLREILREFKEEILQQVCDEIDRIDARLSEIVESS